MYVGGREYELAKSLTLDPDGACIAKAGMFGCADPVVAWNGMSIGGLTQLPRARTGWRRAGPHDASMLDRMRRHRERGTIRRS
jgi:hypothetical protein